MEEDLTNNAFSDSMDNSTSDIGKSPFQNEIQIIHSRNNNSKSNTTYSENEEEESQSQLRPLPHYLHSYISYFQVQLYFNKLNKNSKIWNLLQNQSKSTWMIEVPEASIENQFNDMLRHQSDTIPVALLKATTTASQDKKAIKLFNLILKYSGENGRESSFNNSLKIAQKILKFSIGNQLITDELYVQLIKQTQNLTDKKLNLNLWNLFSITAATMPPSRFLFSMIYNYILDVSSSKDNNLDITYLVDKTLYALKRSAKYGCRFYLPSLKELNSFLTGNRLKTILYFMDGSVETVNYTLNTTILDILEQISNKIKLENYKGFALYENKYNEISDNNYLILRDNLYISDILANFGSKKKNNRYSRKLVLRKKIFRKGDDDEIMKETIINLTYIQVHHDFVEGKYPVEDDMAVKLCALQLVSEFGSRSGIVNRDMLLVKLNKLTKKNLKTDFKVRFENNVLKEFEIVKECIPELARLKFIDLIRNLSYGLCTFYNLERIEDPLALLPHKVILGLNKNGLHFLQAHNPNLFLYSVKLKDLKQFGSSRNAVYFKMYISNKYTTFHFKTNNGDEICEIIQIYITDALTKFTGRNVIEDKNLSSSDEFIEFEENPQIKELKEKLDLIEVKHQETIEIVADIEKERNHKIEELKDIANLNLSDDDDFYEEIEEEEAELPSIEMLKIHVQRQKIRLMTIEAKLNIIENNDERFEPIELVYENVNINLANLKDSIKEKEFLIENCLNEKKALKKKIENFDKEMAEFKERLTDEISMIQNGFKTQFEDKEKSIKNLERELECMKIKENEVKTELEEIRPREIEDMKRFKERSRQRKEALLNRIENQNTKINNILKAYRNEQMERRRIYNKIENKKGKIRINIRIRPVITGHVKLNKKSEKANAFLKIQDDMTIEYKCKREKTREYKFDKIYKQDTCQDEVFGDMKDLIQSVLDGHNVSIFAYGQQGSGKTHTIYGSSSPGGGDPGLALRSISHLFECINSDNLNFSVSYSMLEIHHDTFKDLLSHNDNILKLEIKKDSDDMIWAHGATIKKAKSAKDMIDALEEGLNKRNKFKSASNLDNRESMQHSHLIMSIVIESVNLYTNEKIKSKISFIDLASSEREKWSHSNPNETKSVIKSLTTLGDVISALSKNESRVPCRNHKLTMLLSDSLSLSSKILVFVNLSPMENDLEETQNSLNFAARLKNAHYVPLSSRKEIGVLKKKIHYWNCIEKSKINDMVSNFM